MSPALQAIFDRRMQPTRMHALLAAEWFNVEDAVEGCIGNLDVNGGVKTGQAAAQ